MPIQKGFDLSKKILFFIKLNFIFESLTKFSKWIKQNLVQLNFDKNSCGYYLKISCETAIMSKTCCFKISKALCSLLIHVNIQHPQTFNSWSFSSFSCCSCILSSSLKIFSSIRKHNRPAIIHKPRFNEPEWSCTSEN